MNRILLILLTLLTAMSQLTAQNPKAYVNQVPDSYDYWLSTPVGSKYTKPGRKVPLIVYVHGASVCGTNMNKALSQGTLEAFGRGLKLDAYVYAPQNPGGAWNPKKIIKGVDYLIEKYPDIDTNRIYVIGMSLGGYGAIDIAAEYPDRFAAAAGYCGGATSRNVGQLNKIPLWIAHGTADAAVAVSESDKVVEKMRIADPKTPRLYYDRMPGVNHGRLARFFYVTDVYRWMFQHSLDEPGRPLHKKYLVNNEGLNNPYPSLRVSGVLTLEEVIGEKAVTVEPTPAPAPAPEEEVQPAPTKGEDKPAKGAEEPDDDDELIEIPPKAFYDAAR